MSSATLGAASLPCGVKFQMRRSTSPCEIPRYLSNQDDLLSGSLGGRRSSEDSAHLSPRLAALRAESFDDTDEDGSLAAKLLQELYQAHSGGASDALIMLSQLQVAPATMGPLLPA